MLGALRIPFQVRRSAEDPFLHPGRAARVYVRRGDEELAAGWLGELHPAVAARWDLAAPVAGFELDWGVLVAVAPPDERYEDLTSFPGITQDLAVVVGADVPAADVLDVVRGAGGALLRSAEVFDVYRGAQVGEGRASLAVRMEFRAADRTLTDDEVAQRREKIVAALARAGGRRAPWLTGARVAVLGASGYAGAIAAMLVHRHPFFELAHVTARSEAGARLDDLHPRTRVPMELEPLGPGRCRATSTPRSSAGRTAPPRPPSPRCASAACASSTSPPTSACATAASTRTGTARTARPSCFGQAVYGLPELHRAALPAADLVANPGCYPTAALLALAPLARAGLLGDVIVDAKSGVSGAGREPTATTHFITADENVTPYKVERHRHTPEIEQELAGQGAPVTITFTPHLVPLAQGELVSCYVTPAREHDEAEVMALYDEAYAREPWVELRLGPPGVLDVRETNFCRISVHCDGARPAGSSSSARSTTSGRARRRRPCRTSTRCSAATSGRGCGEPSPRAGRSRRDFVTEVPEGGLAAGFRAAGVAAGIKPSGDPDLGLLVCSEPGAVSAARFTASGVLAAPVVLMQTRCRLDALRAVVVNSGNANAATGNRGLEDAARMQGAAAMAAGVHEEQVGVARTGVIGVPMPMDGVPRGVLGAREELAPDGDAAFWRAIATTDAFEKRLTLDVALPSGGTVRISAQAKGAGMIQPELRDDALLRADRRGAAGRDRGPAARRLRQALLRPHLGRRPALHERHGDPDGLGRERRRRRPRDA